MKPFNKAGSGNWKSGSRGGYKGGKKFGGQGGGDAWQRGGDRDERPAMHSAVCSQCHADCEVPFKPNGRKPIFCSNCFRKDEGAAPSFRSNASHTGGDDVAKQLKTLNKKMDRILEALSDLGGDEE